jgi:hypothetical protein
MFHDVSFSHNMTFWTPCYCLSSICINYLVVAYIVGNILTQHHTSVAKEGVWWSLSTHSCSRSNLYSTKRGQFRQAPCAKPRKTLLIGAGI